MAQERIVCVAHIQRWNENDYAENLFEAPFDATDRVLAMGREAAIELRDNTAESDDLAPVEILDLVSKIPGGTFYVTCEDAIRSYFDTTP